MSIAYSTAYDTNELEMGESGLGINSNNIFLFASEILSLHSYMYIKVVESNSNMFRTNVRDSPQPGSSSVQRAFNGLYGLLTKWLMIYST